jgi:hypothetical protein
MNIRRGMGRGTGKIGYYNLAPMDSHIHSLSMEYWGASDAVLRQAYSDMKFPRYRMGDWIGMFIQNEGYDAGGETATKVLAHAYIKADGNIDRMILDLRLTDYEVDRSWEKIDLRQK